MKLSARPLILLFAAFFLLGNVAACFDDDDEDGGVVIQPFSIDLEMNSTNAAAVEGIDFEFDDLSSLDSRLSGATTVSFPTANTMRFEGGGTVVEGPVTFSDGACTVEGIVADPCKLTITTNEPIQAGNSVLGPLLQRSISPPDMLVAGPGLFPALVQFGGSNASLRFTLGSAISGVTLGQVGFASADDDDDCIAIDGNCTSANINDITGAIGSGQ